ncbi:MAG: CDP-diacylglycerol--serine O-phosphatidyltransferase [Chitinophagales bacterium]|nr:CDP-diacylglycerol--serine O-phosphatidyltransferase [Chitinophagales bacterium]
MIKQHIPNALTMLNLLCGVLGIICCINGEIYAVPVLIAVALVADFLDGFVARALNVKSELGKQLDSLADCVTFGVLPGIILLFLFQVNSNGILGFSILHPTIAFSAFLYPIFAALRLGIFNIDTRQTTTFIGLPTPAGAMFILGLLLIYLMKSPGMMEWVTNPLMLVITSIGLAFLMVSPIPMFSLKMNFKNWKENKIQLVFILIAIVSIAVLREVALPFIMLVYIGIGIATFLLGKDVPLIN